MCTPLDLKTGQKIVAHGDEKNALWRWMVLRMSEWVELLEKLHSDKGATWLGPFGSETRDATSIDLAFVMMFEAEIGWFWVFAWSLFVENEKSSWTRSFKSICYLIKRFFVSLKYLWTFQINFAKKIFLAISKSSKTQILDQFDFKSMRPVSLVLEKNEEKIKNVCGMVERWNILQLSICNRLWPE